MNTDPRKPAKPKSLCLRIWDWIFVCSQTALGTLLVVAWFQASRWNRHIDTFYHPVAGTTVIVLLLVTPLFLVIATPFFWSRLPSAVMGFCVGVVGLLYVLTPTF
jgi:hypothetical protein